jgi:hypothetical protein
MRKEETVFVSALKARNKYEPVGSVPDGNYRKMNR